MVGLSVISQNRRETAFSSGVQFQREGGLAGVEVRLEFLEHGLLRERLLVAALGVLGHAVQPLLHGFQVGQHQFGGDGFDVAHGVHAAGHVMDVRVLKTADDLDDGIHFADVGEEFVAQTLRPATRL